MKTIVPFVLLGLLLGAGATKTLAVEPSSDASAPKGQITTGKVLVLENERTLEGDIERIGEQYRLRRTVGETWVPADRVLHLCATNEEAYAFLRSRSNLNDPDERLKLAEWCHQHMMRSQALSEIEAAVKLRPQHVPSKRLLGHLQQVAAQGEPGAAQLRREEPEPMPALNIELTGEALGQFTSRVQPILMNACASCHATGRGGSFKLQRAYEIGNRRVTQQNLAAVLAQINPQQPDASPFLIKALAVHGEMAQAPFRNRQWPAYRNLEDWVRLTLGNHQAVVETVRNQAGMAAFPSAGPKRVALATERPLAGEQPPVPPIASPAEMPPGQPPPTQVEPSDRWDPEEFEKLNQGQPNSRNRPQGGRPDQ